MRSCSLASCGLQNLQLHFTAHFELGSHADRQRDVRARDMSRTKAKRHRNSEIANHSQDHFFERVILSWTLLAIQHLAEDNATNVFQLARQLQLHHYAINLVRLGRDVLYEKKCARGSDVISHSEQA